jgi:flagellar biosynthesis/type III secretory pathway protein FliH
MSMSKSDPDKETEWSFPNIDITSDGNDSAEASYVHNIEKVADNEESDDEVTNVFDSEFLIKNVVTEAELKKNSEEMAALEARYAEEMELVKSEFDRKIKSINSVMSAIESPLSIFDDEMIDLIQVMMKKVVKKIIYKEVNVDPDLIIKMVEELKKLFQAQTGVTAVYLSDPDFQLIDHNNINPEIVISMDASLDPGDIIIKSNYSEIQAIVNERIDHLLGIHYG